MSPWRSASASDQLTWLTQALSDGAGAATGIRIFRTSTLTTFERPCENDWRKLPASTVLPSSNLPAGRNDRRPSPDTISGTLRCAGMPS
jgi:hypothetical protein